MLTETTDKVVSTREAAKILGVSLRTVQLWVESGVLKAWKTAGGHRRVTLSSINEVMADRQESIAPQVPAPVNDNKLFHILLVEDDDAIRNLFYYFFSSWKYPVRIETASNGFEGLISLGREIPDLLITDLNMPSMNGFDMIRHLKKSKQFNQLKILILTAMNAAHIADMGGFPKDIKVFYKPVAFSELEPVIEALINNKNPDR